MALSAQQLALRMAKHIGVTSFDPADPSNTNPTTGRGLKPGDIEELTACINAALQELWNDAPLALRTTQIAAELRAPFSLEVFAAQNSTTVGIASYQTWMGHCSIRLQGDATDNTLLEGSRLLRPYAGSSGMKSAVLFSDAVTPSSAVMGVVGPLECNNLEGERWGLRRLDTRQDLIAFRAANQQASDKPEVCLVESYTNLVTLQRGWIIRVYPYPKVPMVLTYGAQLAMRPVVPVDISTIPDLNVNLHLPGGWTESVLLPLAIKRLSIHPDFASLNAQTRAEMDRAAETARRIIRGASPDRGARSMVPVFR